MNHFRHELNFGQGSGDHRLARGQVLIDFHRIGAARQFRQPERNHGHIEAVHPGGGFIVGHFADKRDVCELLCCRDVAVVGAAHQDKIPVWKPMRRLNDQFDVEPVGDGAQIPRNRAPGCVSRNFRALAEIVDLPRVSDQQVRHGFCDDFRQRGRGGHYKVGPFQQARFFFDHTGAVGGESGVVVHAVIDRQATRYRFRQRAPERKIDDGHRVFQTPSVDQPAYRVRQKIPLRVCQQVLIDVWMSAGYGKSHERHVGCRRLQDVEFGHFRRFEGRGQIEDAMPPQRKLPGELLRTLKTVVPVDHRKDQDVETTRRTFEVLKRSDIAFCLGTVGGTVDCDRQVHRPRRQQPLESS